MTITSEIFRFLTIASTQKNEMILNHWHNNELNKIHNFADVKCKPFPNATKWNVIRGTQKDLWSNSACLL